MTRIRDTPRKELRYGYFGFGEVFVIRKNPADRAHQGVAVCIKPVVTKKMMPPGVYFWDVGIYRDNLVIYTEP